MLNDFKTNTALGRGCLWRKKRVRKQGFGAGLKAFWLLLVLCLSAYFVSADVVLTDTEYNELMRQLDYLDAIYNEMDKIYNEKLQELNERENELQQRETELKQREEDLLERRLGLQERQSSLSVRERQVELLEASLKERKLEQNRARISDALDKILWGVVGFGLGTLR